MEYSPSRLDRFFCVTGVLNLIVAYTCSTDVWVNFKLFGLMGLTLLFTLASAFIFLDLSLNLIRKENKDESHSHIRKNQPSA